MESTSRLAAEKTGQVQITLKKRARVSFPDTPPVND
jgi:hypothetical protein